MTQENFDFLVATTADLDGTLTATLMDNDGIVNKVLQNNIANSLQVTWTLSGNLIAADSLNGTWRIEAFFERIGGGPEFALPAVFPIPWNHANPAVYVQNIPIPANFVPNGAYKVVVLVSHLNAANNPTRMCGFVEIPMMRFY